MTQQEQALADEKRRAEIANLIAQSSKLNAETEKINRKTVWYPIVFAAGLIAAFAATVKFFF
jgi:hypothetical protein